MTRGRLSDQEYLSIAGDAILRAHQRYDPSKSQFITYLSYFLRGSLTKFLKQHGQERLPINEGVYPDPGELAVREELQEIVQQALRSLDDVHREVVMFRMYHDFSFRQISEHVGLSISSIWRIYHEALTTLRHLLISEYDLRD